jgi:membrane protein DedA with SNARE-associated domain
MHKTLEFVLRHGYLVVLGWVFAEQIGLPLPSFPLLLAAGALAGRARMNFFVVLGVTMAGAIAADTVWYSFGRRRGIGVLHLICRISLEPDSCVRRTEGIFAKLGSRSLIIAKFLPGLNTVAAPLAGIFRMQPKKFLLYDALGALVWAGSLLGLGFLFSNQIEAVASRAGELGGWLLVLLVGSLAAYILWKWVARQRFLRELRIARITPEELKQKIDAGENVVIVDLRHSVDFEANPELIPGAFHMDAKELEEKKGVLPQGREVVLYCT